MLANDTVEGFPGTTTSHARAVERFIKEASRCAVACIECADACFAEQDTARLARCIQANADCADTCETLARLAARRHRLDGEIVRGMLRLCAIACERSAAECDRYAARYEQCRICAEACRACANRCREILRSLI
jgi:hypothetical protein